MKLSVTADAKGGVMKARTFKREIAKGMRMNAGLSGKMAAYRCHQFTVVANAKDVVTDVRKAYSVIGEEGWHFKAHFMIKEYMGQEKANEWTRNFYGYTKADQNKDLGEQLKYKDPIEEFRKIRFPGGKKTTKEAEYLAYRKANNYVLPSGKSQNRRILGVVTKENRDKLEEKRLNTRGLAKMAWKACFEKLNNGRKANVVSLMGSEKREFDKRYKKAYEKFGKQSLGSATVVYNKQGFNVKLTNHVRYADSAFLEWGRDKVNPLVKRYMKIIFDLRKKNASKAAAAASRRRAEIKMAA
jgi:hypothetical protein